MLQTIYTIGHSKHDIEYFLQLLNQYQINCLIDVRSSPYSRIYPQFNKETLRSTLKKAKILYANLKNEFGARHTNPNLMDELGRVDFHKVRQSKSFKQGINRLKSGLEMEYRIVLMCAEANPFDCHRFSMISYQLVRDGINVSHILQDGRIIDNSKLEELLLEKYNKTIPHPDLFTNITKDKQIEIAYEHRGKDIAYAPKTLSDDAVNM